uniref:Uncharacterized protein n=1 Tax=Brassica oleracea TaxID=3712 RepID=A0A3P6DP48_BRAOL|nr:unnamed protein product [Brassica oleracea]
MTKPRNIGVLSQLLLTALISPILAVSSLSNGGDHERFKRRDPLNSFTYYNGSFDVRDKHYCMGSYGIYWNTRLLRRRSFAYCRRLFRTIPSFLRQKKTRFFHAMPISGPLLSSSLFTSPPLHVSLHGSVRDSYSSEPELEEQNRGDERDNRQSRRRC